MISPDCPKNINCSLDKETAEHLLDCEQKSQDENVSQNLSTDVVSNQGLIPIRGKYDLLANWDEPAYSSFNKKCLQGWRMFFIVVCVPFILIPVYMNGPIYMFCYATQWGCQLLCYACLLSYLASRRPDSYCLKAAACIVGQIGIGLNYVIMLGWWLVVAEIYMPMAPTIQYKAALVLAHIIPIIIQVINLILSDIRISNWDVWHFWLLAAFYLFINWIFCEVGDEPIYPLLTWEDWKSPVSSAVFTLMGTLCYLLTGWIVDKLRDSPYPKNVVYEDGQYYIKVSESSEIQDEITPTVNDEEQQQS